MRNFLIVIIALIAYGCANTTTQSSPYQRLAPTYRQSILVSDIERSLALYRDVLGLTVSKINPVDADSYSSVFFNIPQGAMTRFAYLDGEDGRKNVLGLGEVTGVTLTAPAGPRSVAFVQTVADIESVIRQVEALGLTVLPPTEFISQETGDRAIETGVVDFDGHLIMFYGTIRSAE